MARRNPKDPPAKYRWKKGQSGNPEGGRKHDPVRKAMKAMALDSYQEIIEALLVGNLDRLTEIINDPKTPAIQAGVGRALFNAINEGDFEVLDRIVARIVGKTPDEVNLIAKNFNTNLNAAIPRDKLKAALAELELEN